MKKYYLLIAWAFTGMSLQSCTEFLDAKPDQNLVIPSSLDDYQGILDAEQRGMNSFPINGMISSDDNVFGNGLLQQLPYGLVALYFWEKELYISDEEEINWIFPYQKVFYANVVLDGLAGYVPANAAERQRMAELEASARFYRAMGHYEILMHFAEPFDPARADQLGIPIRLTSDINQKVKRSTMLEGFAQIIADLESGLEVLSEKADVPTRPSKWAAYAMLGRVYLNMHRYGLAYENSKKALEIGNELMDYKTIETDLPYSFEVFNPEVIHHQGQYTANHTFDAENFVNPDLVSLYDQSDLRLKFFFQPSGTEGRLNFRGNYTGDYYYFGGIATDEVMLNLSESAFRVGKEAEALDALNVLLVRRMEAGFEALSGLSGDSLMNRIVEERRKELAYRGIRWLDLKRYNFYPELRIDLTRDYNTKEASLPSGDSRYTFLIPPAEMNLNPMEQNIR